MQKLKFERWMDFSGYDALLSKWLINFQESLILPLVIPGKLVATYHYVKRINSPSFCTFINNLIFSCRMKSAAALETGFPLRDHYPKDF